ncbi:hypothetical protein NDU88_006790 [Pleurodeles waltl]|uniref:Uncharacterized protein n=1 Tax=Pleurodeles waltl TaxID=8319 RepID=A0AAV7PM23_PLEWA|nr:hypothetical protein NDU88_006790 [Pleurodeles waltl]
MEKSSRVCTGNHTANTNYKIVPAKEEFRGGFYAPFSKLFDCGRDSRVDQFGACINMLPEDTTSKPREPASRENRTRRFVGAI